jgi:hypothetical protein
MLSSLDPRSLMSNSAASLWFSLVISHAFIIPRAISSRPISHSIGPLLKNCASSYIVLNSLSPIL